MIDGLMIVQANVYIYHNPRFLIFFFFRFLILILSYDDLN